ncbi:MAG: hypothetical protein D6730_02760 [Bacteroidetes bacterium]|nr:MAG: hypothetical protein D6730_02760 [Bacteroidota bacterium]
MHDRTRYLVEKILPVTALVFALAYLISTEYRGLMQQAYYLCMQELYQPLPPPPPPPPDIKRYHFPSQQNAVSYRKKCNRAKIKALKSHPQFPSKSTTSYYSTFSPEREKLRRKLMQIDTHQ